MSVVDPTFAQVEIRCMMLAHPHKRSLRRAGFSMFVLLSAWSLAACSEGNISEPTDVLGDLGGNDNGSDTPVDSVSGAEVRVCVINASGPNAACSTSGALDFQLAEIGVPMVRYVRVDNATGAQLTFLATRLEDARFAVRVQSYDVGAEDPDLTLPLSRADLSRTFFEVTFTADGGLLDADTFYIDTDFAAAPTIEVRILSAVGGDCPAGFGDCDGSSDGVCEADLRSSLEHCGGCNQPCNVQHAVGGCDNGVCGYTDCEEGYVDGNGNRSDGCEFFCTRQSDSDLPDAAFDDANCDGVDGDLARAVFVAPDGFDNAAGTREDPLKTITAGIAKAAATDGLDQVLVSKGTYEESLVLVDGVSVFGSYDRADGWSRSTLNETHIVWSTVTSGHIVVVDGTDLATETWLGGFIIEAGDATATDIGVSSYGVHCTNCVGLRLVGNVIAGGNGGPGSPGQGGTAGGVGSVGNNGGNGSCDGSSRGSSGPGGGSACGRNGGAGGTGGSEGKNSGDAGGTGIVGTPGGPGGGGGDPGGDGADGTDGSPGAPGTPGSGGDAAGTVVAAWWVGTNGGNGGTGEDGNGGGGGGGGGGQGCTFCNDGTGNGGGGGGGGGCGGTPGTGGTAGGGSFAVFLTSSAGCVVTQNTLRSGLGGDGGMGGGGGQGGSGATGGFGATSCSDEIGEGGNGGAGGAGGNGGGGGGGAGGVSFGLYLIDTDVYPWDNTIEAGAGGRGGGSGGTGARGADGQSGPVN